MRKLVIWITAVLLVGHVIGCSPDKAAAPDVSADIIGIWGASAMDGHPLPWAQMIAGADTAYFMLGLLELDADGSWSQEIGTRTVSGGTVTLGSVEDLGHFVRTGSQVVFYSSANVAIMDGTIASDAITVTYLTRVIRYPLS